jgi:hypothetical protein
VESSTLSYTVCKIPFLSYILGMLPGIPPCLTAKRQGFRISLGDIGQPFRGLQQRRSACWNGSLQLVQDQADVLREEA